MAFSVVADLADVGRGWRDRDEVLEAPATDGQRSIDDGVAAELAADLRRHELDAQARLPLTDGIPGLTIADAYAIQRAYLADRLASGARLVGRKVGATNPVIQALFSVDQPDYGVLLDDMVLADGARIATRRLIAPRVEPEIGFILGEALEGPGVTPVQVLLATRGLVPCFEIIDSRIVDWRIGLVDTIADKIGRAHV